MFAVFLAGILQGVDRTASVYSIMPNLMFLQYVEASFQLPSVSTANINTVQYTKSYLQYEITNNSTCFDTQVAASSVQTLTCTVMLQWTEGQ